MTVSAYQIDNVIKAYSKQTKTRFRGEACAAGPAQSGPIDYVSLKGQVGEKDIYQKISYTLLDLLKK